MTLGTSAGTKNRYQAGITEWSSYLDTLEISDVYLRSWKPEEKEVLVASFLNHLRTRE